MLRLYILCFIFVDAARVRDVFVSPFTGVQYTGIRSIGKGTVGYVVLATAESEEPKVVVKCDTSRSLDYEGDFLQRFPVTRSSLLDRVIWKERNTRWFDISPAHCLVLTLFGPTMQDLRKLNERKWDWDVLADLGVQLTNIVAEFHAGGYAHNDFHPGNIAVKNATALPGDHDRFDIVPLDLGDMQPLTPLSIRNRDIRQVMCTIQYLFEGDSKLYAEKRTPIERIRAAHMSSDVPATFKYLVEYAYGLDDESSIDYRWISDQFASLSVSPNIREYLEPSMLKHVNIIAWFWSLFQ